MGEFIGMNRAYLFSFFNIQTPWEKEQRVNSVALSLTTRQRN